MQVFASAPGLRRVFATSIVARLPPAMFSIALLAHAQHLTGSFAAAGIVTGAYAIGLGAGGPFLAKLVDRRGQTSTLLASAAVSATLLGAIEALSPRSSIAVLVTLAAGVGLATPPVDACFRSQLPNLLPDPSDAPRIYAFEASVVELTYVCGPPLALCIGALWSTGAALAVGGVVLLAATTAFAAQPASRGRRPAAPERRPLGGPLRSPAMRTLVIVMIGVGALLGADEVAVIAAAKALGATTAVAPLFAVWGAGSFVGGLLVARLGGGARTATGLAFWLGALTIGHCALISVHASVLALGTVLLVAGATIAPTEASVYSMVNGATPSLGPTEAFAWLATAMAVGGAGGAAGAGLLVDRIGPTAAFALAGCAGALALLATTLKPHTLTPHQRLRHRMGASSGRRLARIAVERDQRPTRHDRPSKIERAEKGGPATLMEVGSALSYPRFLRIAPATVAISRTVSGHAYASRPEVLRSILGGGSSAYVGRRILANLKV